MKTRPYQRGTAKIAGKGPSNVDSIPAELAPREAVLNAPAADMLGRDKIAKLNAAGNAARHTDSHGRPISGLEHAMHAHADRLHPVRR